MDWEFPSKTEVSIAVVEDKAHFLQKLALYSSHFIQISSPITFGRHWGSSTVQSRPWSRVRQWETGKHIACGHLRKASRCLLYSPRWHRLNKPLKHSFLRPPTIFASTTVHIPISAANGGSRPQQSSVLYNLVSVPEASHLWYCMRFASWRKNSMLLCNFYFFLS